MEESKTPKNDNDSTIAFFMGACAIVMVCIVLSVKAILNEPKHTDAVTLLTFVITTVTLLVVCYQVFLARQELRAVQIDLTRSLRESKLWPYGRIINGGRTIDDYENSTLAWWRLSLKMRILNTGEVVDLIYTVIVGVDGAYLRIDEDAENKWESLDWIPDESSHYATYNFYKYVSHTPVYIENYVEMPTLYLISDDEHWKHVHNRHVLCLISSNYERNPTGLYTYFIVQRYRSGAKHSIIANVKGGKDIFDKPDYGQDLAE